MGINIKATGKMVNDAARESTITQMVMFMRVNGLLI